MTPYQQKFVDHLVRLAIVDKVYAWSAAKKYAEIFPEELGEVPQLLTSAMKERQRLREQQTEEGGKSE